MTTYLNNCHVVFPDDSASVDFVFWVLTHCEKSAYHDHNYEAVSRHGRNHEIVFDRDQNFAEMMSCDQIRAVVVLCIGLVLDIVNVNEEAEDSDYFLGDSHPDKVVSSSHDVRTGCNVDHQMCACSNSKCEAEAHCYFGENAHQVDSCLVDFHMVCGHCYYSERSTDWCVD